MCSCHPSAASVVPEWHTSIYTDAVPDTELRRGSRSEDHREEQIGGFWRVSAGFCPKKPAYESCAFSRSCKGWRVLRVSFGTYYNFYRQSILCAHPLLLLHPPPPQRNQIG